MESAMKEDMKPDTPIEYLSRNFSSGVWSEARCEQSVNKKKQHNE
jgi:hypothetical protein